MKLKGLRVVRGPDWKWGDQDGGEGCVGSVVGYKKNNKELIDRRIYIPIVKKLVEDSIAIEDCIRANGIVKVIWDCGTKADYRAGFDGAHDLRILDSAMGGEKHVNVQCHLCKISEIFGMRWQCAICNADFCTNCFYQIGNKKQNQHEHYVAFKRYDVQDSEPVTIFVDCKKSRRNLKGIFEGAKVKRGIDWNYDNEDGNELIGEVLTTPESMLLQGKVNVRWGSSSQTFTYRRGCDGKMDLMTIEPITGGCYQSDWLRVLRASKTDHFGKIQNKFTVGDRVKIVVNVKELREKQAQLGGWNPSMETVIGGEIGTVVKVDSNGGAHVRFEKMEKKWCFNPAVLERLSKFSLNQIVRVRNDELTVKTMQAKLGNKMAYSVAGESGKVERIEDDYIYLDFMEKELSLRGMQPEWLEILPITTKLHDRLSKLSSKLGDLFVEAAQEGDLYLLKELVQHFKVSKDVVHTSKPGLTALHLACRRGRREVVEWLLSASKVDLEKVDDKGRTAVYHAVKGGEVEILKIIISNGADLDVQTKRKRYTALHKAASKQQTKCAEMLIESNCKVNVQDENGDTALHIAAWKMVDDFHTVFDAIISSGSTDLAIKNMKGFSAFHVAVYSGNFRAVSKYLEMKKDDLILERIADSQLNALHLASLKGHSKIAESLLTYIRNLSNQHMEENEMYTNFINAKNRDGHTPLMIASWENHYTLIEHLVIAGADVNTTDKDGDTAISLIMMKINSSKLKPNPIPTESVEIKRMYMELSGLPVNHETMRKHPSLAAVCYLISKGGHLEMDGPKPTNTNVNDILNGFVSMFKRTTKSNDVRDTNGCILCGRPSSEELYECCNGKSSIICSGCRNTLQKCPCCNKTIKKTFINYHSRKKEPVASVETYINNLSYYPMDLTDHDISDSETFEPSKTEGSLPMVTNNPRKENKSTSTETNYMMMETSDHQSEQLATPFIQNRITLRLTELAEAAAAIVGNDREPQWTLLPGGSRKGTDLLKDRDGNTYTKRSPNMWQCTKKSDSHNNKCPALVKEKNGTYIVIKAEHRHSHPALKN